MPTFCQSTSCCLFTGKLTYYKRVPTSGLIELFRLRKNTYFDLSLNWWFVCYNPTKSKTKVVGFPQTFNLRFVRTACEKLSTNVNETFHTYCYIDLVSNNVSCVSEKKIGAKCFTKRPFCNKDVLKSLKKSSI